MSEAGKPAETLRAWDWRDVRRAIAAAVASVPGLIVAGWREDALRRVLFVPALMGAGIGIYFTLRSEPPLWSALSGPSLAAIWLLARRGGWPRLIAPAAAVTCVAVGFSLAVARSHANNVTTIARETRLLAITGRVARVEPADRGRTRVWLDVFETSPRLPRTPGRVRISVGKTGATLSPGDWIRVRARLRPLPDPVAPGSYDFGRKLWFEGIGGVGFSLAPVARIEAPREESLSERLTGWIQAVRHHVSERIRAAMSPRAGPIAAALLTGERGLISDEDNEAMRDSSLAHLLSISGLHMALAGFGFFMALRFLFALVPAIVLKHPVKKWAAAAALGASFAYLLLSGASLPTQRAFVMIAVALIAILFDRAALNMRTVAIAAVVVLVMTPEAWVDPSFQMSFAAVVALIAVYEWWNERRLPDVGPRGLLRSGWQMLLAAAATSFIAGLATAPFAAFHFNRFADYGVAANVMVMPIVSFVIMPAGVLALVLMPFGLEWLPLAAMEQGIEAMLAVAHWVSSWPGAAQAVAAWPVEALALVAAGGLWIAGWQAQWRWLGVAAIIGGIAMSFFATRPDVVIAGDGDNIAVRDARGRLHLLHSRRGRFDAEIWMRRDGDPREIAVVARDHDGGFVCDEAGCIARIRGRRDRLLAAVLSGEAMAKDCGSATIVVDLARGWRPACEGPALVVTRKMLQREGAIEVRLSHDQIEWTSVARERGARAWTNPALSSGERGR